MGYSTDFYGQFNLDKPLTVAHLNYLTKFAETRRMKRNASILENSDKTLTHQKVGLPIGIQGEYFVDGAGSYGQEKDDSILEYNSPPDTQPGLWCQWTPSEDGTAIVWDEGEKFYDYEKWIEYIIQNFLKLWGYTLNGEVKWEGEGSGDMGKMSIVDNVLTVKRATITYE